MNKLTVTVIVLLFLVASILMGACTTSQPVETTGITEVEVTKIVEVEVTRVVEVIVEPTDEPTPEPTLEPTPEPEPEFYPVLSEEALDLVLYSNDDMNGYEGYSIWGNGRDQEFIYQFSVDSDFETGTSDLVMSYFHYDDDWLFIDSILLRIDDEVHDLQLVWNDTDVLDGGKIEEYIGILVPGDVMKQLGDAKEAKIRLDGSEGYTDITLDEEERMHAQIIYALRENINDGTVLTKEFEDGECHLGCEDWWMYTDKETEEGA
jgi:hypothetical protein